MRYLLILLGLPFCLGSILWGCISAEETGGGRNVSGPVHTTPAAPKPTPVRRDTARTVVVPKDTARQVIHRPGFTSKQDTVIASVQKRTSRPRKQPNNHSTETPLSGYTLQVGAFARESNAKRFQTHIERLFPDQTVHSRFSQSMKVFRVSVGTFSSWREANAFRNGILKKFPDAYNASWVNLLGK